MAARKRFYFGTNFKMHQTPDESAAFLLDLHTTWTGQAHIQLFILPPFTSLARLNDQRNGIWVGAQTMHEAEAGAFTGEISAPMLAALNLDLVMLGHAERRQHFGETDAALRKKVRRALDHGLRVLLCVGENAFEHEMEVTQETLARQLKIALHDVRSRDLFDADSPRLLVAYEPVWAIGVGGRPARVPDVESAVVSIRAALASLFGDDSADIPLLYGGSVDATNCGGYARIDGMDGLFVGRAAASVAGFVGVLEMALAAKNI
jgi:triosephosphate isomerase